jgi:predicted ATP-grasp superfamily ATP-dependent carboligase
MMRIDDISIPVVILRAHGHGALGILRSLGRLGVAAYVVDPDPMAPAFISRYCQRKFVYDIENGSAQRSVQYLLDVARKLGQRSILIPTSDVTALFVADNAQALKEWFLFPDQSAELSHALASKKQMYYLAKRLAIPTPECVFPRSRRDASDFLQRATFPVMLKGINTELQRKLSAKGMFIVHTPSELLEAYDAWEDPQKPNLMIQEFIPGGDDTVWMFNGYFNERSECLVSFTGKKIRQCPVYRGVTSLGICLKNETVERTTKAFMRSIGYQGNLDIGYRFDARDGLYKVLDVNPRIGSTFRLFVAENGLDVAHALYLHLTGQPVPSAIPQEGRKWVVEDLDSVSSFRYWRDGKLTFKEWLSSFRGVQETAYWALDDLLPLISMFLVRLAELVRRIYRKLSGRAARVAALALKQPPTQALEEVHRLGGEPIGKP